MVSDSVTEHLDLRLKHNHDGKFHRNDYNTPATEPLHEVYNPFYATTYDSTFRSLDPKFIEVCRGHPITTHKNEEAVAIENVKVLPTDIFLNGIYKKADDLHPAWEYRKEAADVLSPRSSFASPRTSKSMRNSFMSNRKSSSKNVYY